jgi:hypothetical protein
VMCDELLGHYEAVLGTAATRTQTEKKRLVAGSLRHDAERARGETEGTDREEVAV